MTERLAPLSMIVMLAVLASGCEIIGNIFQAGMVTGVLLVFAVIGLVVWLLSRLF
ncbi:MAG: hypothetical protein AB7O67_21420 [Vicinamibacterales bacterium]